jgi:hypothetical protein
MLRIFITLPLILLLITTGCAGTLAKSNSYQITHNRGVPKPSDGNAVVCVYRIWRFRNGGATFNVFKDGKIVGVSYRGSYFCHETPPGEYSYYVEWGGFFEKVTTSTIIHAEANKQYFISFLSDVPDMKEVSKTLALKEIQGLEYVEYLHPDIRK